MFKDPNLAKKITNFAEDLLKSWTPRKSWSLFFPGLLCGLFSYLFTIWSKGSARWLASCWLFSKHRPSGPMLSISQMSVCLFVCLSVCPSVCVFTYEVPFKRLFAPPSQSRMSNIFRDSESLGKSNGKKWSQIGTFQFGSGLSYRRKKSFFGGWFCDICFFYFVLTALWWFFSKRWIDHFEDTKSIVMNYFMYTLKFDNSQKMANQ